MSRVAMTNSSVSVVTSVYPWHTSVIRRLTVWTAQMRLAAVSFNIVMQRVHYTLSLRSMICDFDKLKYLFALMLLFIAPAFSKVRYRGSTFRPFVRPSTICVESRKFMSSLGINYISLQQW